MKTTFRKYIIPALVLLFLLGCDNLLEPPVKGGPDYAGYPADTGYFSLSLGEKGAGRTILPEYILDDFGRFELKFTPVDGTPADQLFSVKGTLAEVSELIPLKAGNYTLTVTAYFLEGEGAEEQEKAAARKELPIIITAGNTTTESAALEPIFDPGPESTEKGIFTWKITLPVDETGLTDAIARITPLNDNNPEDENVYDLFEYEYVDFVEEEEVRISEHSLELHQGYYRVVFTLTDENGETAEWREILHVYQNMESKFEEDFTLLDFHESAVEITNNNLFGLEKHYATLGAAIAAANTVTGSSEGIPVEIILLNDVNAHAGYTVQKNIRLLGNDYIIYAGAGDFALFTVDGADATLALGNGDDASGTLTLNGGDETPQLTTAPGVTGVEVKAGRLIIEENTTITGFNNLLDGGGGVRVVDNGTFDMRGGSIQDNSNEQGGGGVYVDGGTFTMSGGSITENDGGYDHSRFGGGVYVANGTFTMTGGTISGNKAQYGGGVAIYGSGDTFTMQGGTIKGNTANSSGGGVSVTEGSLIMEGGTIYGSGEVVDPNTVTNPGGSGAAVHLIYNGSARYAGSTYGNSVIGTTNLDNAIGIDDTLPTNEVRITNFGDFSGLDEYYPTLTAAIQDILTNGGAGSASNKLIDIQLLKDINATTYSVGYGHIRILGNNHTIYAAPGDNPLFTVTDDINDNASLTLGNGDDTSGTLTLDGNDEDAGTNRLGVAIQQNASFTMEKNTTIKGFKNTGNGGAVNAAYQSFFTMNGGTIKGNSANMGGGVYAAGDGTFTMNGGTIHGSGEAEDPNTATAIGNGAAIYVGSGSTGGAAYGNDYAVIYGTDPITTSDNTLPPPLPEALIMGGDSYATLAEAISAAPTGGTETTIRILKDINDSPNHTLPANSNIVITAASPYTIHKTTAGSLFTVNSANASLTLGNNITLQGFESNTAALVTVDSGNLVMESGSKITGNTNTNTNTDGGGVRVTYIGNFTMNSGAEISGNTASGDGGGVYFSGDTFTMNTDAVINGNTANGSSGGGGVYVLSGGTVTLDGIISGNTASGSGGGVLINSTTVTAAGKIFDNTATDGGGVLVLGDGAEFILNTGGEISGNTSGGSGGGVEINGGKFTLDGGAVSGNTANGSSIGGGGVFVSNKGSFTLTSGNIFGNKAPNGYGGGVYIFTASDTAENLTTFTKTGGTIYGNDAAEELKNTAVDGMGHAVYMNANTRITPQIPLKYQDNTVTGAMNAGTGEGFIVPEARIGFSTYYETLADAVSQAAAGSTITVIKDITVPSGQTGYTVGKSITIEGDVAGRKISRPSGYGSIFGVNTGGTLTLNNITLEGNAGNTFALVSLSGTLTLGNGSRITGNTNSSGTGGGVNMTGGTLNITGGFINNNQSTGGRGGAVYMDTGILTMSGGGISGNTVTGDGDSTGLGGGVYAAEGPATVTITGGTIDNNHAVAGGGVYISGADFTMSGGTINGSADTDPNTATGGQGAAIYVNGGNAAYGGDYGTGSISTSNDHLPPPPEAEITNYNSFSGLQSEYMTLGAAITAANTVTTSSETTPVEIRLLKEVSASAGYTVTKNIRLLGEGKTITAAAGDFALFTIDGSGAFLALGNTAGTSGTLTLDGNDAAAQDNRRGVYVYSGKLLIEENTTIQGFNSTGLGAGVSMVLGSSIVEMTGGSITENSAVNGGGVYNNGIFIMLDGTIKGNTANSNGGGVYVAANADFTMEGGTINGSTGAEANTATEGAAIYLYGGTAQYGGDYAATYGTGPIAISDNALPHSALDAEITSFGSFTGIQGEYATLEAAIAAANTVTTSSGANPVEIRLHKEISASAGYTVSKHIRLLGNGKTITAAAGGFPLFKVNSGASLRLGNTDGTSGNLTLDGNNTAAENNRRGVYILQGKLFIEENTTIKGFNSTSNGAGVCVQGSGGSIEMTGGSITENNGSGVLVYGSGAAFTMQGGTIKGNTNTVSSGGGVQVSQQGKFTMQGGTIKGNTAGSGGGVYVENAFFTMSGGTIHGSADTEPNTATTGAAFGINGGTAQYGGDYTSYGTNITTSAGRLPH